MKLGRALSVERGVEAKHSLSRRDGKWYQHLTDFPGVFHDLNGYVLFETETEYKNSPYLQHGATVHVPNGIASVPGYVRVP